MIAIRKDARWKTVLVLFCLLARSIAGSAQYKAVDSLDNLIRNSHSDTSRLHFMTAKAQLFSDFNLDSSMLLIRQVIAEAERINDKKTEISCRVTQASNFCFKGDYDSAKRQLELAHSLATDEKDITRLAMVAGTYGMMYGMQGKYDSSTGFFLQAIHYAELARDSPRLATAYRNLATSLQMQSKFFEALSYNQKSLKISEARKDLTGQAYLYLNIGMVYNGISDSVRAEQNWLKCIELARQRKLTQVELYGTVNLASLYSNERRFADAYAYASSGVRLARETGDPGMEATATSRQAVCLEGLHRLPEAVELGKKAIALAEKSRQNFNIYQVNSDYGNLLSHQEKYQEAITRYERGFMAMKGSDLFDEQYANGYKMLSQAYEKSGRYKEALEALRSGSRISDSIVSKDNVRKTTEMALNFDFEKKEQAAQLKRQQDEQAAKNRQKILAGGLLFTILLAGVAWYAFSIKKKANVSLENQKAALQTALSELKDTQAQLIESEKMASLGELTAGIAHEIQNPLNFVNNFSDVSVELLEELKGAVFAGNREEVSQLASDLEGNLEKILHHGKRADAIVKGMLQHSRSSSDQKELTDLNALADEYLRLSYHGLRAKNKSFNASLHTDFDPLLTRTAVVPQDIGRVILNLLTNAFYAVDEKQKMAMAGYLPSVWISTRKTEEMVNISVRDNGNGIPEKIRDKMFQPFFTTKPTGQGTGLGLSLSYDIVKAHGGEIIVESKEGEGTQFTILLPFRPETPKENAGSNI